MGSESAGAGHAAGASGGEQRVRRSGRQESELRELSRQECLELLSEHRFGRLAIVMSNGSPIIRPVNYVFDRGSQSVVFRTARGSKFHAVLRASRAAFEIDGIDEAAGTGWSVIVDGVTAEVTTPTEIGRPERLGLRPWAPGPKPHWVRIRARTVSGRRIVLLQHDRLGWFRE